ncbi:DUF444 family protein [Rubinisphaera margarita]|uniref:DUF444 family protein n=1 Tax=Rubinisphaera margarita TaxID=2909586 RepID=UPI001EE99E67|nr:DUF444 family protein [Rubinisphaera margarita]MCG6157405.1 DUF444 family protein [Rubinisphaera margarita]
MTQNIDRDLQRFKHIVKGKVRGNLRKYVTHGEMLGRKGREVVSIPVPNIDIPHFRHGKKGSGGAGQGEGEVGQSLGPGEPEPGTGEAGSEPGRHVREVEVSLEELAMMLGEELELPNIVPKGAETLDAVKDRYNSVSQVGPDSLRHFKRTYKQALKRQIATGQYNPDRPIVIPTRDDTVYKSWTTVSEPRANAVIIYVMDVSGSMGDEQKEIVRTAAFWIDTWLSSQYRGLQKRYVVHDAAAHEVDEDTFFRIRESGGTRISSAYEKISHIIESRYPVADWNIYVFQFSDGDNWGDDNNACLSILKNHILPVSNLFCYGQVESPYGSGEYLREVRHIAEIFDNVTTSLIEDKNGIYGCIKDFLGTGK